MISEPNWLLRIVECFDKKTGDLVYNHVLPKTELELLQKKWGLPVNEPMMDVFSINEEQSNFLSSIDNDLVFEFDKYDYQISAITNDWEKTKSDGGFMGKYPPPKDLTAFPDLKRVKSK